MRRLPLSALRKVARLPGVGNPRICMSSTAPEKVEVFIDDKPIMVEPGTTVLQVKFITVCFDNL